MGDERDIELSDKERDELFLAVAEAFHTRVAADSLLRRIGYPAASLPTFSRSRDFWAEVVLDLDNGVIDQPYRRLLVGALRVYAANPVFRAMAARHGLAAGDATPPPATPPEPPVVSVTVEGPDSRRSEVRVPSGQSFRDIVEEILEEAYPRVAGEPVPVTRTPPDTRTTLHPSRVPLHLQTQMESAIGPAGTPLLLLVSRTELPSTSHTHRRGKIEVDPNQPVLIEMKGGHGIEIAGHARREFTIPDRGRPAAFVFPLVPGRDTATAREVEVTVRQAGGRPWEIRLHLWNRHPGDVDDSLHRPLLRIDRRDGRYHYALNALGVQLECDQQIKGSNRKFVQWLYKEIEGLGENAGRSRERLARELRTHGCELFDRLFPQELQSFVWENRERLHTLQIRSNEALIPWELLHLKRPGHPPDTNDCFLADLGLVRWPRTGEDPPLRLAVRRDAVQLLCPEYTGVPPVRAGERAFLCERLGTQLTAASYDGVLRLLGAENAFDLLHFIGHGDTPNSNINDAHVLLQGGDPATHELLKVGVVKHNMARRTDGRRPVVFLNACRTGRIGPSLSGIGGFADAFIFGGAGMFVSSLWKIGDDDSAHFAKAFYRALLRGMSVAQATVDARAVARASGDSSWLAYTVYADPDAVFELVGGG
jgi:hypothetical protein